MKDLTNFRFRDFRFQLHEKSLEFRVQLLVFIFSTTLSRGEKMLGDVNKRLFREINKCPTFPNLFAVIPYFYVFWMNFITGERFGIGKSGD